MAGYSIAVDIGGTFTDVVLRADDGRLWVDKTLSTHHDLLEGIFVGVHRVLGKAGIGPRDATGLFVHATTTVTNALIERRGPVTALVVTEGFRDILTIRAEHRYDIYDLQIEFTDPLVPDALTFPVRERVHADGTVAMAIDPAEVARIADALKACGAKSVAISLINSYRNPANERRLAERLRSLLPDVYLSLSSEVAPQIREYPRTSTTAINAYTMPIARPYLGALGKRLAEEGFPNKPLIMLSSGGIVGAEVAGRNPVRMIESGPAAGALAASYFAKRMGLSRLMSFDMGGTTAKACLIEGGQPLVTGTFEVDRRYRFKEGSGMPVTVPAIDLIEIGAGGGSIASVDALGLLKVGPRSAGSQPGPACYGRGGTSPTVTDADLVLGVLDAESFLGGDMKLDLAAARKAFDALGAQLGKTGVEAAAGVYRLVAESMAAATRTHATDRGVDYRGMPLFAFGGAGPVHACMVGELLQSESVIFAPQASVLSAFGTLVSPPRLDLVKSELGLLASLDWREVDRIYAELIDEATRALVDAGCKPSDLHFEFGADLRFAGQANEVSVALPEDPRRTRDAAAIEAVFEKAYTAQYGVAPSHVPVELVSWRLAVRGPALDVATTAPRSTTPASPKAHRAVHLWPAHPRVPVFDRYALALGQRIDGPAILEERETTIAVPPGWRATTDAHGCVVATRSNER